VPNNAKKTITITKSLASPKKLVFCFSDGSDLADDVEDAFCTSLKNMSKLISEIGTGRNLVWKCSQHSYVSEIYCEVYIP